MNASVAQDVDPAPALDLARRLHQTVAQRLAGLSYLLAADRAPASEALDRCRSEVEAALGELRDALSSVTAAGTGRNATDIETELRALLENCPGIHLQWGLDDSFEIEPGSLVESFLVEALRNAHKHARPTKVVVEVIDQPGATVIEVSNDGPARPAGGSCGVGGHLLELEASLYGALVESKPEPPDRWLQRLLLPARQQPGGMHPVASVRGQALPTPA